MTMRCRDGADSPFSQWIRAHPELDSIKERLAVNDVDYIIHQYRAHHDCVGARMVDSIMLLELKTYCADLTFAQRDTMMLVDQMLRGTDFTRARSYRRIKGPFGERRIVRCFGVIQLRMSHARPDESDLLVWNGQLIDLPRLVELLKFERDPHAPSKRLEYRRHHTPSPSQRHPTLFAVQA